MRRAITLLLTTALLLCSVGTGVAGQEVPFTLEHRDRLIRIEATLAEF